MLKLARLGLVAVAGLALLGYAQGCSSNPTRYPPNTGDGGFMAIGGTMTSMGGNGGFGGVVPMGGHGFGGESVGGNGSGGQPDGIGGQSLGGRGMGGYATGGQGAGGFGVGGAGIGGFGEGGFGVGGANIGGQGAGGVIAQPCVQLSTRATCDASTYCHSVFLDPHNCSCAGAGCCAQFNHCADGGVAQCYGGVSCAVATPFCEAPYVVAYRLDCYEGCVAATDCAPVCTPGADQTCNDNPIVSSLHGHCNTAGQCVCNTGFVFNPNTGRCL